MVELENDWVRQSTVYTRMFAEVLCYESPIYATLSLSTLVEHQLNAFAITCIISQVKCMLAGATVWL
jgi:hypothetical protein